MLFLVPSFMGYAEDAKIQVRKANTRTVWTAAKATETQAEYKAITDDNFTSTVLEKIGSTFKSDDVTLTTVNTKVTKVIYQKCETNNGETFTGVGCPASK